MKTAINNAKIFIGNGLILENAGISFDETGILEISRQGTLSGDELIDGTNMTVLPGLIDAHVHLGMKTIPNMTAGLLQDDEFSTTIRACNQLSKMLESGVTTIRNCGTKYGADIKIRDMIDAGEIEGPRILACGQPICITAGHCYAMGTECDNVTEVIRAARNRVKDNVDIIKVMATGGVLTPGDPTKGQLSFEQLKVAKEEAIRFGKKTSAHCIAPVGVEYAVELGFDIVEHGIFLDDEICKKMSKKGTWLVPTMCANYCEWSSEYNPLNTQDGIAIATRSKPYAKNIYRSFENALRNKVNLGVGTDAGTPFNEPSNIALELFLYIEHGMSPIEAICCATLGNATMLGLDKIIGSLEVGKIADILMVQGNPIENIWDLKKVNHTWRGGKKVYTNISNK